MPSCFKCATHGRPSLRATENRTDISTEHASIQRDDLAGVPKPRHNNLATGKELKDGRVAYTSAKTLSRIQEFCKGLIVSLLLNLDTAALTNNADELWAIKKPDLAKMLWGLVRQLFDLGQPLALISESYLASTRCRDSLLKFSSKGLDLGLELEVIDEEQEMGDGKEEEAEDKGHK